jgi:hypothetical protein
MGKMTYAQTVCVDALLNDRATPALDNVDEPKELWSHHIGIISLEMTMPVLKPSISRLGCFRWRRRNLRRHATAVDSEEIVIRMPTMIVIAQIVLVVGRADLWRMFIDLSWAGLAFAERHAKQGLQTIRKRRVRA